MQEREWLQEKDQVQENVILTAVGSWCHFPTPRSTSDFPTLLWDFQYCKDSLGGRGYYILSWISATCIQRLTNRQTFFLFFFSLVVQLSVKFRVQATTGKSSESSLLKGLFKGPAWDRLHLKGQHLYWLELLLCRAKESKKKESR